VLAREVVTAGAALDAPAPNTGAGPAFEPPATARNADAAELDAFWCGAPPVEAAFGVEAFVAEAASARVSCFEAEARFILASAFATASDPFASAGAGTPPADLPPGRAAAAGAAAARSPPFAGFAVGAATLGVDEAAGPPALAAGRAELAAAAMAPPAPPPLPASGLEFPPSADPAFAAVAGAAGAPGAPVGWKGANGGAVALPGATSTVSLDAAFAAGTVARAEGAAFAAAGAGAGAGAAFAAGADAAAVGLRTRKPGENKPPALLPLRAAEAGAASVAAEVPSPL
jgi:hypothetical protein